MILSSEIFSIGRIAKIHGAKQELFFECESDILDNDEIDYVVLEVDAIFVPFFIDSIRLFGVDSGVFTLKNVDTENKRERLVGTKMYLSNEFSHLNKETEKSVVSFTSFEIFNTENQYIGTVKEIDTTTENALFILEKENKEIIYIPIVEDFFVQVDQQNKKIVLDLPQGLLDINI